jgi:hypothetical protein
MSDICWLSFNWIPAITDYLLQIIGVIDVNRSKEKGYTTVVKEGFCDEVKLRFLILFFTFVYHFIMNLDKMLMHFKLKNHVLFKLFRQAFV